MLEKILELFFTKKQSYKKNKITVVRTERERVCKNYCVNEKITSGKNIDISEYFIFRNGLNVAERQFYNSLNVYNRR